MNSKIARVSVFSSLLLLFGTQAFAQSGGGGLICDADSTATSISST